MKDIFKKWWFYLIIIVLLIIITITIISINKHNKKVEQEAYNEVYGNTTVTVDEWLEYFESKETEDTSSNFTLFTVEEYKEHVSNDLISYKNKKTSKEDLKKSMQLSKDSIEVDYKNSNDKEYLYLSYEIDHIIYCIDNNNIDTYIDNHIKK